MNSLYIFGCSFSEDFEKYNGKSPRFSGFPQSRYINEILNGVVPDSWADIVSKKLNLLKKNYSIGGDCNYGIFQKICEHCDEFHENDIIIVQWTNVNRFRLPNSKNEWCTILTNSLLDYNEMSKNTLEEVIVNRSNKLWYDEIYNYEKIIDKLCLLIKCKIFYWSYDSNLIYTLPDELKLQKKYILTDKIKEDMYTLVKNMGGKCINDESEGRIKDGHFGKIGHKVLGNLIYDYIKNV
jgi:hypothetical protein